MLRQSMFVFHSCEFILNIDIIQSTPGCWNGIQDSLKNYWSQGREGSNPSPGTDHLIV